MNVDITGARIYFTIPIFGGIPITATIVNSLLVTLIIIGLSIFLTRNLKVRAVSRRQVVAEFLVETAQNFVNGNMGEKFAYYGPFVAALFASSLFSSLLSLVGMFPPTSDLSTTLAWAVMVFVLITYTKIRTGGVGGYLKGFTQPIFVLTQFNILSELATPISMAFRHFGNIVSGSVITALVYAALATASHALFACCRVRQASCWARSPSCRWRAGGAQRVFRFVLQLYAGVHFLHADNAVYRQRGRRFLTDAKLPFVFPPPAACKGAEITQTIFM